MNKNDLKGLEVREIRQSRYQSNIGSEWCLDEIRFADGWILRFQVLESDVEPDYGVRPILIRGDR